MGVPSRYLEYLPGLGCTLYFTRRPGFDPPSVIWETNVSPIVDLNVDGKIDIKDVVIMTEHWGENYPLCDVGPMPWGDGIVDAQDLLVLAEYMVANSPDVNDANDL